ncbi:MAG: hypothetical protein P8010_06395 [Desulfosarcinaceae bacterium]
MSWLDDIPVFFLVIAALVLGLAPLLPEPHLWEKLKMLLAGELVRPLDIVDLFFHSAPSLLLLVKLARMRRVGTNNRAE